MIERTCCRTRSIASGSKRGLGQRIAQQRHRLVAVFGEEPGRDGQRIVVGVEIEARGEAFAVGGEFLRVALARAFFQKAQS